MACSGFFKSPTCPGPLILSPCNIQHQQSLLYYKPLQDIFCNITLRSLSCFYTKRKKWKSKYTCKSNIQGSMIVFVINFILRQAMLHQGVANFSLRHTWHRTLCWQPQIFSVSYWPRKTACLLYCIEMPLWFLLVCTDLNFLNILSLFLMCLPLNFSHLAFGCQPEFFCDLIAWC